MSCWGFSCFSSRLRRSKEEMEGHRGRASFGEILDPRPDTVPTTWRKSHLGLYLCPGSPRSIAAAASHGDHRIAHVGNTELNSSYTEHCFDGENEASVIVEPRKPASRRLFCRICPCSSDKSVDVESKHICPKSSIPSNLDWNAPFSAGKAGLCSIPERVGEDFKHRFDVEEVAKTTMTPGNCGKDRSFANVASRFSPEKTFSAGMDHQKLLTDSFSFPILNPPSTLDFAKETPRDSFDVFRPSESASSVVKKSAELQRRAVVLQYPGEGDCLSFTHLASLRLRPEEDAASDTSSDLFEIESLTSHLACRRCDSLDGSGASPGAPHQPRKSIEGPQARSPGALTELYAPSEASSEWSIATVEGCDAGSAASSYEEFRFIEVEQGRGQSAAIETNHGAVVDRASN